MFDWNGNSKRDSFDFAMDMMVLDELEQEQKKKRLESGLIGTGYDSFDLELMDEDEREEILLDAGLDPDDYDF